MKPLFILLSLLLLGMQQGVASPKQKQTNPKNDFISSNVENGSTPINIDLIYEFLKAEGYDPKFNTIEDVKYIIIKDIAIKDIDTTVLIFVEDDFVTFHCGSPDISERIKSKFKIKELSDKELTYIYTTCVDLSRLIKCAKISFNPNEEVVYANIESFIPTMELFKHYCYQYMAIVQVAIGTFEESILTMLDESRK